MGNENLQRSSTLWVNRHQILYTPPYWPEFQPIEEIWGLIKNFVANNREDFSMNEADRLLTVGHSKIS
jgi:transposase